MSPIPSKVTSVFHLGIELGNFEYIAAPLKAGQIEGNYFKVCGWILKSCILFQPLVLLLWFPMLVEIHKGLINNINAFVGRWGLLLIVATTFPLVSYMVDVESCT